MLLHQRLEFNQAPAANCDSIVLLRIAASSSTLWTAIESRRQDDSGAVNRSSSFPSRILAPLSPFSVELSGVDNSGLLSIITQQEFRINWRIIHYDDAVVLDSSICSDVLVPLGRSVKFAFAYGGARFISLNMGGIDVTLTYDRQTKILATSWFSVPFRSSWSLATPKRLLSEFLTRLWEEEHPTTEDRRITMSSIPRRVLSAFCIVPVDDEEPSQKIDDATARG